MQIAKIARSMLLQSPNSYSGQTSIYSEYIYVSYFSVVDYLPYVERAGVYRTDVISSNHIAARVIENASAGADRGDERLPKT